MKLVLHTPEQDSDLTALYRKAFDQAEEIFIVAAYLTAWDTSLSLNGGCKSFRLIIGRDFGITRKSACRDVMRWLPRNRKADFFVADSITGFHPKAVFWREKNGICYAIVGSSNLTKAAFDSNYEANSFSRLSKREYSDAVGWVQEIERYALPVTESWLRRYREAPLSRRPPSGKPKRSPGTGPVIKMQLPQVNGRHGLIQSRRRMLDIFESKRSQLGRLFRRCAQGKVSSADFYAELPQYWSDSVGDRIQGKGWERTGARSDFRELSHSMLEILESNENDRDDCVRREKDRLWGRGVETRGSFLSEMLCLHFPDKYPILNGPVESYLAAIGIQLQQGASEGAQYLEIARHLRAALMQNPRYPAKNLAELDALIRDTYK